MKKRGSNSVTVRLIPSHGDFETYSECDLKARGAYAYALDPSTRPLCFCYTIGKSRKIHTWVVGDPYPFKGMDIRLYAWNSQFERLIWNFVMPRYGWPKMKVERFICVAAQARTHASPSSLDKASMFFDVKHKKNMKGHRLMMQLCKPATESQQLKFTQRYTDFVGDPLSDMDEYFDYWEITLIQENGIIEAAKRCHHNPSDLKKLAQYCAQDVRAEFAVYDILEPWRKEDLRAFWDNEHVNDEGLIVDVEFATQAVEYTDAEKEMFTEQLEAMTDGVISTPKQYAKIKEWLTPRMSEAALEECQKYEKGEKKFSLNADNRQRILDMNIENPGFLTGEVERLVDIVDQAGNATIAKYKAITNRAITGVHDDQLRVHGLYMFAGAAQTLRYSSLGLQVHNLNRDIPKEPGLADEMIYAFMRGAENKIRSYGHPVKVLSRLIRATITGNTNYNEDLIWCDWSAIEARILPWLANDRRAEQRLELFRQGKDLYVVTAAQLLGKRESDITHEERQTHGKVPELALGFGGGPGAFAAMASALGSTYSDQEVKRIIAAWREENSWAAHKKSGLWAKVERAAIAAVTRPGKAYRAGRLEYVYDLDALGGMGALWCLLPSGRRLCYPDARVELVTTPWGANKPGITCRKGAWSPKQGSNEWPRTTMWYGLLVENPTQAVSADILATNLSVLRKEPNLTVAGHTHDEIICLAENTKANRNRLESVMCTNPEWAEGLPLDAEVESGFRYKVAA